MRTKRDLVRALERDVEVFLEVTLNHPVRPRVQLRESHLTTTGLQDFLRQRIARILFAREHLKGDHPPSNCTICQTVIDKYSYQKETQSIEEFLVRCRDLFAEFNLIR